MSDPLASQDRHADRLDAHRERLALRREAAAYAPGEPEPPPQPSPLQTSADTPRARRRVLEVTLQRSGWRIRDVHVVDPLEASRRERLHSSERAKERAA